MAANGRYANGARRRALRARHLAQAASVTCQWPGCPWPGAVFDATLPILDPRAPVVDEIVPFSRGGDPLSWENTRLLHRWCNGQRGNGRKGPKAPMAGVYASPGW